MGAYGRKIAALTLQPASGGVFEVTYNGTLIFSKKALERHPRTGEIPELIAAQR